MKSRITILNCVLAVLIYCTFGGFSYSQSITILSPSGGENWRVGSIDNIAWSSSGISTVDISFYNGSAWTVIYSNYLSLDGQHTLAWYPGVTASGAKIKIADHATGAVQFISPDFSLVTANHIHVPADYSNIKDAVAAANDGDIIDIANGTYQLTSFIQLDHQLTIKGESQSGVIIDASGLLDLYEIFVNKSNSSLSNFTLIPGAADGYPIHVSGDPVIYNLVLDNITIDGSGKTPFDFNGVTYLTIQNLTASNTSAGNGLSLAGCVDAYANHITTHGNYWGGLAIYSSVAKHIASQYVTVDGASCSFGEINKVYDQDEAGLFNSYLYILGFDYYVKSLSIPGYTVYQIDRPSAFFVATNSPFPASSSIVRQITTCQYWVKDSMLISPALGDAPDGSIINVLPGVYADNLPITKNVSILGTNGVLSPANGNVITVSGSLTNVSISGFNIIAPVGKLAIANTSTATVDARNNSWGPVNNRAVIKHLTSGQVSFVPWIGMLTGVPNTSWPIGNSLVFTTTPTLEYYLLFGVSGTPTYSVYISTDSASYTTKLGDSTSTTFTVAPGLLSGGQRYYWDVCYSLNGNYSDFGTEQSFRIDNSLSGTPPVPVQTWPINNTLVFTNNPKLEWYLPGSFTGAVNYDVMVYDSSDQDDPVFVAQNITATNQVVTSGLPGGHSYYWIAISHGTSGSSDFSTPATFRVDNSQGGTPPMPIPTWPTAGSTIYETTPNLGWYTSSPFDGALTFDVIIIDNGTGLPVYTQAGLSSTNQSVPSGILLGGHAYSWKVQSHFGGSGSGYSALTTFNVFSDQGGIAPVPVPSWPTNSTVIYTSTPSLEWYLGGAFSGTVTYTVEVFDSATPGTVLFDTTVSGNSAAVSVSLLAGHTYQWHVKSTSSAGSSDFSSFAYFIIDNSLGGVPPKPIQTWPINNASIFVTMPRMEWYLGGNYGSAVTYDIVVYNNLDLVNPVYTATGIAAEFTTLTTALIPGNTYSWKIQAHSGSLVSGYSDLATFNTDGIQFGNPKPYVAWPLGGATIFDLKPLLEWYILGTTTGTVTYEVEVKPLSAPFDAAGTVVTSNSTQNFLYGTSLTPGQAYHWRVRTLSSAAAPSEWSDEILTGGALFTEAGSAMKIVSPVAGSPVNGVLVPSNSICLSWFITTAPAASQSYKLEISKSPDMSNPVSEYDNLSQMNKVVTSLDNGKYYWRVASVSTDGKSFVYSNRGNFNVGGTTGITDETNIIPKNFEVFQNFPNPFNPSTTIKYGLPKAAFVNVKVFNMLGQEVKTLVNEQKNAGTFRVQWNGDNNLGNKVSSGIYIFRVSAGTNSSTMKMILLK